MKVHAGGFAVLGPGLDGWEGSREVLAGRGTYVPTSYTPPAPAALPPNERRRTSAAVRLGLAAAEAAVAASRVDPATLVSVFGSSNGDGAVVGAILEALCRPDHAVSPTQFHNSVHNAPAAYWSIAAQARQGSTSLGCHDDTLAAALLHAATKAALGATPVLLCVYDLPLPPPLSTVRPTDIPFAAAMLLSRDPLPCSRARLDVRFVAGAPPQPPEPEALALRPLYAQNPAARSLRLLELLAGERTGSAHLPYLGDSHLVVTVAPC